MFVDERALKVRAGDGGDGIIAWRREARIPRGGPAGGDGGRGGNVFFLADAQLTTFGDMEDVRHVRAEAGERGGTDKCHGRRGRDRVLRVPPGTTVYEARTGRKLVDLSRPGQRWRAARGGRGGWGNARFASATEQRPQRCQPGGKGQERSVLLELRLLADVGLVGLPNAGKSTLLSRLSRARPKIAAYPFTTLAPHLGIVELPGHRRFVLADLPGLIEGAHQGHGLGDRFLRHVERTRVLLHLVDLTSVDGEGPAQRYGVLRGELERYGRGLAGRPEVVAGTKVDALDEAAREQALRELAAAADREVHPISAVTGEGLRDLLEAVVRVLDAAPAPPEVPDRAPSPGSEADEGAEDPAP